MTAAPSIAPAIRTYAVWTNTIARFGSTVNDGANEDVPAIVVWATTDTKYSAANRPAPIETSEPVDPAA